MSSQKGNVARSRPQRHQNTFSFKNDKFDKSVQTKEYPKCDTEAQSEQMLLEKMTTIDLLNTALPQAFNLFKKEKKKAISVKYNKMSVKCLQKTVKDSYHIMCRPCACDLEVCAKCGKREDVVIPFNIEPEKTENVENNLRSSHRRSCRRNEESDDDLDFDLDDTEENSQMD
ncbi:uncharacterized protein C9orf85 homolog isoform X1 [Physeter macrocephalus]|uniref:Uncharacterized protein C9orf85 homolog isoform X1 n=1 Tax=Physeter macrocephalus TaxID=9755 RepID=A0A9W2WVB1_PHYMC|nr:uncharacterized protein C9orf85 homolog isoform X1 [Physeter catodon]